MIAGACATEADDSDPALEGDGKADGFDPPRKGKLRLDQADGVFAVQFSTENRGETSLAYVEFELSGDATVSFETKYHRTEVPAFNAVNKKLDTVLYVYEPDGSTWGNYLSKDDDSGYGKFSKLSTDLPAGKYRLLLKRKNGSGMPVTDVYYSCDGTGCASPPPPTDGCADGDLACMISNAVAFFGGADPALTKEVQLADMPATVRAEAQRATDEIENRTFEGTDYSAGVVGYYGVYRSATDHTIVAWVVYGTGSGEPDYHDSMIIGIAPDGERVYDEEESG
ncbi:MAG: hypothetical protein SFX73_26130 [Kofleriaceae bacterium]|nr:hypothetical protein [Kofleriaceae bacterium]